MSDAREEALRARHDGAEDYLRDTSCATCRHCPTLANSPDGSEWICTEPAYKGQMVIGEHPRRHGSDCARHDPDLDEQTEEITRNEEELHPRRPGNEPPAEDTDAYAEEPDRDSRQEAWRQVESSLEDAAASIEYAWEQIRELERLTSTAKKITPDQYYLAEEHALKTIHEQLPDRDRFTELTVNDLIDCARRANLAAETLDDHLIAEEEQELASRAADR